MTAALNAARSGDPGWYTFPASTFVNPLALIYRARYALGPWPDFAAYEKWATEHPEVRWLPARTLSAGLSVLVIPATVALALTVGLSPSAALFAGFLVGLSGGHFHLASLVRSDMPLVVFCMLACAFAARGRHLLAGACAGLATASKWPGIFAVVPVVLAIAQAPSPEPPRARRLAIGAGLILFGAWIFAQAHGWHHVWKDLPGFERVPPHFRDGGIYLRKNLLLLGALLAATGAVTAASARAGRVVAGGRTWAAAGAFWLAFALSGPYVLVGGERLVQGLVYESRSQSLTERGQPGWRNLVAYLTGPLAADLGPLALGSAAVAWSLRARERAALPALAFGAAWLAFYTNANIRSVRYVSPLIPLIAIGAADLAFRGIASTASPARIGGAVLAAALVLQPALATRDAYAEFQLPNTRTLASDWFAKEIPPNRTVAIEEHSVALCAHCYAVATPGALYLLTRPTDFAVTSSLVIDYFRAEPERFATELARYEHVLRAYEPIARFFPKPGAARGPEIVIYKRR